ncbi:hypothetical protein SAMN06269185_2067 [Natronoarchaeum philippinense]|uniref:Uncharacterized protein n=1 Tax=Natronoarchaeum philippinense TaxID=558529 RepID=A0A285NUK1_NATPI|nr:hypothetical protein [Natronoarchaeum philippinense]SNZ13174.1 hypothetical protein SAMN06269185_2067 [Natronoarchaeum philippinense]
MATSLDDDRDAPRSDSPLLGVDVECDDDRVALVARVLVTEFGGPALCQFGRAPTAAAARRIAQDRTGCEATPLPDICSEADLDVPTTARAENALLSELTNPAAPDEIRQLAERVERCRQVLVATARERAGPPRITTVLCGDGTTDPDDVEVPAHVEPLPPGESVEELKAYYHRLRSDLRCARLGFRLYDAVVEAELGGPQ